MPLSASEALPRKSKPVQSSTTERQARELSSPSSSSQLGRLTCVRHLLPPPPRAHHPPRKPDRGRSRNLIVASFSTSIRRPEARLSLYINSPWGSVTAASPSTTRCKYIRPGVSTFCVARREQGGLLLAAAESRALRACHGPTLIHRRSAACRFRPPTSTSRRARIIRLREQMNNIW